MTSLTINCRFLTQPLTGVQRFAEEITRELCQRVPDVSLVAPGAGSLRRSEIGGVPVQRIGRMGGHLWEQLELPRALGRDTILLSLANTGPLFRRRQVVAVHDVAFIRHPDSYNRAFRFAYRIAVPVLVRSAERVITVSNFSKSELEALYGRRDIQVVPNAAGSLPSAPKRPATRAVPERFFLVVGSSNRHKNTTRAISAFAEYRRRGGQNGLVLAGDRNRNFASVDAADRSGGIVELGRVSDAELAWLYDHCEAFIFPSLYEGFGIPPIEAQSVGATVLAADIPVLREIMVSDSALWFDPSTDQSLADLLMAIERTTIPRIDPAVARGNARRFNWGTSAEILLDTVLAQWLDGHK